MVSDTINHDVIVDNILKSQTHPSRLTHVCLFIDQVAYILKVNH